MQTHDVLYNAYQTALGGAIFKNNGNTSTTLEYLLSSDNYLFWGRANVVTGAVANSATAPIMQMFA